MQSLPVSRPALPACLNLGSGKDFRDDCFNLDVDDTWAPDAVCDLSRVGDLARGVRLDTMRFGAVDLRPGAFETIIANDVLEHVPDLMAMMTTCLALLREGGLFQISVPYDLSFGAWQDPTHVRAFNERSWLYYTEWFWYMGWSEFRFALETFDFVPSPLGAALREKDVPRVEIVRTPRAIDSMSVGLRKIALTPEDRATWAHWRERRHAAQQRKAAATRLEEIDAQDLAAEPLAPKPAAAKPAAGVPVLTVVAGQGSAGSLRAFDGALAAERDRYCIWIVTPPDYAHQHAYDEVALGLSEAFAELGGSAPVIRDPGHSVGRTMIVLGPQLLPPSAGGLLPAASVLFNLEQADTTSPWMSGPYLDLLRNRPVVDYSRRNQAALRDFGIAHARLLPIGYAPGLTRIAPSPKDIDVLFYGSLNDRRRHVLDALKTRGVTVLHLFGVYGATRDAAIARSRIVLNMHFYETAIFESVRVSFLLANGACVVSEGEASDPDLAAFAGGLSVARFADLVDRCLHLLARPDERDALARAGFAALAKRPQSALLASLFRP